MKKVFQTTIVLLFTANLIAQNPNGWIEDGAEFYHHIQDAGSSGYARYYLDEEFELNGLIFQRLKVEMKTKTLVGPNQYVENDLVQLPWSRLFHTSNDTVYFASENGNLGFAWHLNPQIGDVWDFGAFSLVTDPTQMIHAYAKVTDVQNVVVSGVPSKDITFETCLNIQGSPLPLQGEQFESYLWVYHQGKINTIFGPHNNFHYLGFFEVDPNAIYCPWSFSGLACYRSSAIDLTHFFESQSCTGGVVNLESIDMKDFAIYPNPASTTLNITNSELIKSIKIFDAQGRLQMYSALLPLNLSNISEGMYCVQIETLDGQVKMEKLVVE